MAPDPADSIDHLSTKVAALESLTETRLNHVGTRLDDLESLMADVLARLRPPTETS